MKNRFFEHPGVFDSDSKQICEECLGEQDENGFDKPINDSTVCSIARALNQNPESPALNASELQRVRPDCPNNIRLPLTVNNHN